MSFVSIKSFFKPLAALDPPQPSASPDKVPVMESPSLELGASPILSGNVCKRSKELSADLPLLRGRKRKVRARLLESDSEEDIPDNTTDNVVDRKLARVRPEHKPDSKLLEAKFDNFRSPDTNKSMVASPISASVISSPKITPGLNGTFDKFEENSLKRLKISGTTVIPVTPTSPLIERELMDTCEQDIAIESPVPKTKCNPISKNTHTPEAKNSSPSISHPHIVSKSNYYPDQRDYHPVDSACWETKTPIPYLALARTFQAVESNSSRLRIQSILCNYLRSVLALSSPQELICSVYLTLNRLGPAWRGEELGVGEGVLIRALVQATGRSQKAIKDELYKVGDIGLVAESSRCTQRMMFKPSALTVEAVFSKLQEIARFTGCSSQQKKVEKISALLVACRDTETRYLIRGLSGKLRIRLQEQTVLTSLAHAVCLHEMERSGKCAKGEELKEKMDTAVQTLKSVYCELPDYERVIPALLEQGLEALPKFCCLTPGIPLKPMLAQPTKGLSEIFKRVDQAAISCEYKYDGERAQIHVIAPGKVRIFSRNQEDMTDKFPDVIDRLPRHLGNNVASCVLDSEVVARDTEKNQKLPFQVLTTRKRKGVSLEEIKVQVCVYAFDLLYLNGESLVHESFRRRSKIMRNSFKPVDGEFVFSEQKITSCTEDIQAFFEGSLKDQCEGLMIKTLDHNATYEISKRSFNWLKLKKDYLDGTGDTLDLVVVGAYQGTGKRTGNYGGFLLACYDPDSEEYQVICKTGTGFSDAQLEAQYNILKQHVIPIPKPYYSLGTCPAPDVWFDSNYVWEVKAADFSLSPIYPAAAGLADRERGISLRFPRFIRVREDKTPEDATTSEQIAHMYRSQQSVSGIITSTTGEDYY
ncbi:DNA ligase 1 isoform X2 [Oopsacas minuta]|uniref:DNA ligase n=1 Tax=Oopsacas minuta TaxID=111878 RepID=A0AAV7K0Y8_9METZ|nr:DNA ligase 1 isoform X2 [Oopsacas minuta]